MSFSVVVIFLVAIGIYWLMEQLQEDYMDQYLSILGDKLIAMVPEVSEKSTLKNIFDEFRFDVENDQVSPEQVEKVAAGIFNIDLLTDSLSLAEAIVLLELPEIAPPPPVKEFDSKSWRDLEQRLERVYRFEEKAKFVPKLRFQVDNRLNIIIDEQNKNLISQQEHQQMVLELKELEEKNAVFWISQLDESMQDKAHKIIKIREDRIDIDATKAKKIKQTIHLQIDSLHTVLTMKIDSANIAIPVDVDVKFQKKR